jgi:CRP-like cAMP-binding protein
MMEKSIELFDQFLLSFGIENKSTLKLVRDKVLFKSYPKHTVLIAEDKMNSLEYIGIKGVLHRYNENEEGKQVSTGFYISNQVVTPHFARTIHGKSLFSLETLTDCLIAEIEVKDLDELRYSNSDIRAFGQRVLEIELKSNLVNAIQFRNMTAKERLMILRKEFPNIENTIPLHIIASYLGITHVSFSRLRNELANSN